MRALVWCIGALELVRVMPAELRHLPALSWLWLVGVAVWLFAGAVLVALPLVRLYGKVGGGVKVSGPRAGTLPAPPPRKDA